MRSDIERIRHESNTQREKIKENTEKVKLNKQLPWLVGNVVEVLQLTDEPEEEEVCIQHSLCIFSVPFCGKLS
jgi:26S proteasome regulatory subunit T5